MVRKLWSDESGVIISAELALVLTIAVLAMVVGLSEVAVAVNTELNDISNAIGALNQSYSVTGFIGTNGNGGGGKLKSWALGVLGCGFGYSDAVDDCDCNTTCDIVCGAPGDTPHAG
ncbi:MAG: hypothetical protein FJ267_02025 [Planctomycetes bacterium]|nr:hypothetical protein [Planctomycetota bacterium]